MLARVSPFVWFLTPLLGGLFVSLGLDLGAWVTGAETFSQAMDALGTANPWVKLVWVAGSAAASAALYWHFWIQGKHRPNLRA